MGRRKRERDWGASRESGRKKEGLRRIKGVRDRERDWGGGRERWTGEENEGERERGIEE